MSRACLRKLAEELQEHPARLRESEPPVSNLMKELMEMYVEAQSSTIEGEVGGTANDGDEEPVDEASLDEYLRCLHTGTVSL